MRLTADKAKIVQRQIFVEVGDCVLRTEFKHGKLLVFGVNGVHMYGDAHVHFVPKIVLDVVDDVVAFGYIDVGRHFDVCNHEAVIFAVAVYDQIVHADNAVVGQNLCGDFVNEFFGRFFAEDGGHRFFDEKYARHNDKCRHGDTHDAVNAHFRADFVARNVDDYRRNQNGNRCQNVVSAVCRRRFERAAVYCFRKVEIATPKTT